MKLNIKSARGFTLVELLVVIAIIAGLAAVSTPVIFKMKGKAKRVSAVNACNAVEVAVNAFKNDYNFLPYVGSAPDEDNDTALLSDAEIMNVLAGKDDQVNFKEKVYFEFNNAKGGPGNYFDGLHVENTTAALFDPWGEPYRIFFDYDLDGAINHPVDTTRTINGKYVAVYSKGKDKAEGTTAKNRDNASNF